MALRDLTRKLQKKISKKNKTLKRQRGGNCGCGSKQSGGRVVKPAEYYGGNSKRYHKMAPMPEDHAYGKTHAVSFGSIASDMASTGPNLGPYPNSSGMMTGGAGCNSHKQDGGRLSRNRRKKSKSSKSGKSSKSSMRRKASRSSKSKKSKSSRVSRK